MTIVRSRVVDTTGAPHQGATVTARLLAPAAWLADQTGQALVHASAVTGPDGWWTLDLTPTGAYEDSGAAYLVAEETVAGTTRRTVIDVPDTGEHLMRSLAVNPPIPGAWQPITELGHLSNVDTAGAASGDLLVFDGADWAPSPPPDLTHDHDAAYAATGHDHSGVYSPLSHNHDAAYAALAHGHPTADALTYGDLVSTAPRMHVRSDDALSAGWTTYMGTVAPRPVTYSELRMWCAVSAATVTADIGIYHGSPTAQTEVFTASVTDWGRTTGLYTLPLGGPRTLAAGDHIYVVIAASVANTRWGRVGTGHINGLLNPSGRILTAFKSGVALPGATWNPQDGTWTAWANTLWWAVA